MKIQPVITEKSTQLAQEGKYTFMVDKSLTKHQIKSLVQEIFDVKVVSVRTLKVPGEIKASFSRRKKIIKPAKKAIVTLAEKDKIDIFETKKK